MWRWSHDPTDLPTLQQQLQPRPDLPGEEGEMTVDMTNNRVPYGLLTDEEKAALHEHEKAGGGFLYTTVSDTYWRIDCEKCGWYPDYAYRTVPIKKTQDVIAWDRLPDWVEWVARDESRKVNCSDVEPKYCVAHWLYRMPTDVRRIDDFPGIVVQIGTCDWKESKMRRPR
jgi:hypothetical protein